MKEIEVSDIEGEVIKLEAIQEVVVTESDSWNFLVETISGYYKILYMSYYNVEWIKVQELR